MHAGVEPEDHRDSRCILCWGPDDEPGTGDNLPPVPLSPGGSQGSHWRGETWLGIQAGGKAGAKPTLSSQRAQWAPGGLGRQLALSCGPEAPRRQKVLGLPGHRSGDEYPTPRPGALGQGAGRVGAQPRLVVSRQVNAPTGGHAGLGACPWHPPLCRLGMNGWLPVPQSSTTGTQGDVDWL